MGRGSLPRHVAKPIVDRSGNMDVSRTGGFPHLRWVFPTLALFPTLAFPTLAQGNMHVSHTCVGKVQRGGPPAAAAQEAEMNEQVRMDRLKLDEERRILGKKEHEAALQLVKEMEATERAKEKQDGKTASGSGQTAAQVLPAVAATATQPVVQVPLVELAIVVWIVAFI